MPRARQLYLKSEENPVYVLQTTTRLKFKLNCVTNDVQRKALAHNGARCHCTAGVFYWVSEKQWESRKILYKPFDEFRLEFNRINSPVMNHLLVQAYFFQTCKMKRNIRLVLTLSTMFDVHNHIIFTFTLFSITETKNERLS